MSFIKIIFLLLFLTYTSISGVYAQQYSPALQKVLSKNKALKPYLKNAQNYHIQIIYTPVSETNQLGETQYWRYMPQEYFYPASTVKLPLALLALEFLKKKGLDSQSPYSSISTLPNYPSVSGDSTAASGEASVAHYVKKILLVSDNDAYNRLYDLLGPDYINENLKKKGFDHVRINHRLDIFMSQSQNSQVPEVYIGTQKIHGLTYAKNVYTADAPILIGKAHYSMGQKLNEPLDFMAKNAFDLADQHQLLKSFFFPESVPENQRWDLTEKDRLMVENFMKMTPRESSDPKYDLPDNYVKTMLLALPKGVQISNKIGDAYGFLIENGMIFDPKTKVKFLISAVIYANENETLNDNTYQYDTVSIPFMKSLAAALYEQNLQSPRRRQTKK